MKQNKQTENTLLQKNWNMENIERIFLLSSQLFGPILWTFLLSHWHHFLKDGSSYHGFSQNQLTIIYLQHIFLETHLFLSKITKGIESNDETIAYLRAKYIFCRNFLSHWQHNGTIPKSVFLANIWDWDFIQSYSTIKYW